MSCLWSVAQMRIPAPMEEAIWGVRPAELMIFQSLVALVPPAMESPAPGTQQWLKKCAADIARDACGQQIDTLMDLMQALHEEGEGPGPSAAPTRSVARVLDRLVEVFAMTNSSLLRAAIAELFEEADWPLLASAGAKVSPGTVKRLQAVMQQKRDLTSRSLALRIMALTTDLSRAEPAALAETMQSMLTSTVPEECRAAAMALLAMLRRAPGSMQPKGLAAVVEQAVGDVAVEESVAIVLLEACRYIPRGPADPVLIRLRDGVICAVPSLQHPQAVIIAFECLSAFAMLGELSSALPCISLLLYYIVEGHHPSITARAAGLLSRIAAFLPIASPVSEGKDLVKALVKRTGSTLEPEVKANVISVLEVMARRGWAGRTLKGLLSMFEANLRDHSRTPESDPPPPGFLCLAWSRCFAAAFPSPEGAQWDRACEACGQAITNFGDRVMDTLTRVIGEADRGLHRSGCEATATGEQEGVEDLLWAVLVLAGTHKAGADAAVSLVSRLHGVLSARDERYLTLSPSIMARLAWVDTWFVVQDAVQRRDSEAARILDVPNVESSTDHSIQSSLASLVALIRSTRGTVMDQRSTQQALVSAIASCADDSTSMDVDDTEGSRTHRAASDAVSRLVTTGSGWNCYRLAREAMLNGYFGAARRLLERLQKPEVQSDTVQAWLQCLLCITTAEDAIPEAPPDDEAIILYRVKPLYTTALALSRRLEAIRPLTFAWNRRFLEARLEMIMALSKARAIVRELRIGGRPAGYKSTRHYQYQARFPRVFRRLARIFRGLYQDCMQTGPQTRWTLKALGGVSMLLQQAWQATVLQQGRAGGAAGAAGSKGVEEVQPSPSGKLMEGSEAGRPSNRWPKSGPQQGMPLIRVCKAIDDRLGALLPVETKKGSLQVSLQQWSEIERSIAAVPFPIPRRLFRFRPTMGVRIYPVTPALPSDQEDNTVEMSCVKDSQLLLTGTLLDISERELDVLHSVVLTVHINDGDSRACEGYRAVERGTPTGFKTEISCMLQSDAAFTGLLQVPHEAFVAGHGEDNMSICVSLRDLYGRMWTVPGQHGVDLTVVALIS